MVIYQTKIVNYTAYLVVHFTKYNLSLYNMKDRGDNMAQKKYETFKVNGDHLLTKVKELINQGNVRKISIKDKNGKSIAEFPLTVGVVGAFIAPVLAAVAAIAALLSELTISVEREVKE